jgi:mannitol/fructose-specific phosphotransferase system IIA component (Ntr-type)
MELKRRLGLVHVFAIASGAMMSSGLFALPGIAAAGTGPVSAPILVAAAFCSVMFLWYLAYVRRRSNREFALIHILERHTARDITGYSMENELKDIPRERDEIVEDRFDNLIKECPVLDIDRPCGLQGLLPKVSDVLAWDLGLDSAQVLEKLGAREEESSTVIIEGVAIPHVMTEGSGKFGIVLARSRDGIHFSDGHRNVHPIFTPVGTRDERNFHLRALAAIASIVPKPSFDERWMQARSAREQRDVILLGERKRHAPTVEER